MVENFCSRASPTNSREGERKASKAARVWRRGVGVWCAPTPLYIEGGAALAPPPSPKDKEWGAWTLPSSRNPISSLNDLNSLGSAGPYGALCPWPNAARTLPHRPMPPPGRWDHVGPLPEGSRSFRYNTDLPGTIPNSKNCTALYESYSPDHSGTSRDIPDPIRDSEQKIHKPSIQSILASRHVKCVTLRVREYADMIFYQ